MQESRRGTRTMSRDGSTMFHNRGVPWGHTDIGDHGDNRTTVGWMNGLHGGMRLRQRTANWVTHIFREHKEDDLWAGNGGGVQKNGWTPPALRGEKFLVSVVSGMEALTTANAGEAIVLMAFLEHHRWFPFY